MSKILLGAIVLGILISDDFEYEKMEHDHYCEMIMLWNEFSHLSEEERPGWPPYRGEC